VKHGGEGTNRTYLDPLDEPTTVLKTAGATRHPSLSRFEIYDLRFTIYEAGKGAGDLDLQIVNRKWKPSPLRPRGLEHRLRVGELSRGELGMDFLPLTVTSKRRRPRARA